MRERGDEVVLCGGDALELLVELEAVAHQLELPLEHRMREEEEAQQEEEVLYHGQV